MPRDLDKVANPAQIAELRQAQDLLRWLDDGNFTFLGYREYDLVNEDGEDVLELREDSGLGLLAAAATPASVQHLTDAGRQEGAGKARPGHHQSQFPLHGAPAGLPGLHRRQEL